MSARIDGCSRIEREGGFLDWRHGSGGTVEIFDIEVSSEYRRKGIGRKLVNTLYNHISRDVVLVFAITRADNFIAQQFYEEMGYRVVAVLRRFYKDPDRDIVDAVMYGRDLPEPTK